MSKIVLAASKLHADPPVRVLAPDMGKTKMETFAIITTEPCELLAGTTGHDRMPLIIDKRDYQRWLEPGIEERPPIDLIRPFDSDRIKAWCVDRRVNDVKNNDRSLTRRASLLFAHMMDALEMSGKIFHLAALFGARGVQPPMSAPAECAQSGRLSELRPLRLD